MQFEIYFDTRFEALELLTKFNREFQRHGQLCYVTISMNDFGWMFDNMEQLSCVKEVTIKLKKKKRFDRLISVLPFCFPSLQSLKIEHSLQVDPPYLQFLKQNIPSLVHIDI